MKISNVLCRAGQSPVACVEVDGRMSIYDIAFHRNAAGLLRCYAPLAGSRHIVTFDPAFANEMINLAEAELKGSKSIYASSSN